MTDEDLRERASIDGRVTFAVAAFALSVGLVALLDRIGVPEAVVRVLGPIFALVGLSLIGLLLHAVRVSRFYAAGRAVPSPYAGLASVALATALLMPFLPPLVSGSWAGYGSLAAGFGLGLLLNWLLLGPLLRKTGAFSLPDLVAQRFPHTGVRLGVIAVVAGSAALIGLAGFETSIRALSFVLGADRGYAVALIGIVLLLMTAPGGMAGLVWAATGAAGIFIAALCLPLATILVGGDSLPIPLVGDGAGWGQAMNRIAAWQGFSGWSDVSVAQVLAIAIGVASLCPLLSPAVTTNDGSAARTAGVSAMVWGLAMLALVLVTIATSAQVLAEYLIGERPDRLPTFAYAASGGGLLRICGAYVVSPEQALAACSAATGFSGLVLRSQDFAPEGFWLLHGLPELYGYGVATTGLVGSVIVAIALVLCGAGIQSFATAIGHDALYRVRESQALTSRRLAMTRVVIVIGIVGSGLVVWHIKLDPRQLIGLAVVLSAACLAPLLALALWPRASGSDSAIALLVGLVAATVLIGLRGDYSDFGILASSALVAAVLAFVTGVGVSFLHSGGLATEGSAFVHGLLHGEDDVFTHDKGA